ncbi:MAG: hypothetical protein ACUZ8E_03425 [Candidatus Anammoxibacter sp.]
MHKKKKPKNKDMYTCKSCGNISTSKQHLCSPIPQEKTVVCNSCGKIDCNPRHICSPNELRFKYSCDSCGKTAVSKNHLCTPVKTHAAMQAIS